MGALTEAGEWVRPEPVLAAEVSRAGSVWQYRHWTRAELGPPAVADPRPEDRELLGAAELATAWSAQQCRQFADSHVDATVYQALSGERSLGMIYASLHRVYVKRATRGRVFLRFVFSDATGEEFDWIVPDVSLAALLADAHEGDLPVQAAERTRADLERHGPLLLTLGLTRPNNRFPGKFRGCHPLVVGVHPAVVGATTAASAQTASR